MKITIIGIDCATQSEKVGLAVGLYQDGKVGLGKVEIAKDYDSLVDTIVGWLTPYTLIALDAPLGWPLDLGKELFDHVAGQPLNIDASKLFRRQTDRFIKENIGKQPLDVGADRIARTAHWALGLLRDIRKNVGSEIPLAWEPLKEPGIYAIEVYPAATLKACGNDIQGYKDPKNREAREKLTLSLPSFINLPPDTSKMVESDHILDAVTCLLAGADFQAGRAYPPLDLDAAKKEGWIWTRKMA